jgi:hypothetical protein
MGCTSVPVHGHHRGVEHASLSWISWLWSCAPGWASYQCMAHGLFTCYWSLVERFQDSPLPITCLSCFCVLNKFPWVPSVSVLPHQSLYPSFQSHYKYLFLLSGLFFHSFKYLLKTRSSVVQFIMFSFMITAFYKLKNLCLVGLWWLMPVILATWEAEIGRIEARGLPGQIVRETLSAK